MSAVAGSGAPEAEVVFHDAECGGYRADLGIWSGLARERAGELPVLDLGAGTGRVAIPLAREGHRVLAVERDPLLAAELDSRAEGLGPRPQVLVADARDLDPALGPISLALAPMQFMQLLDEADRACVLERVAATLAPGGTFATALLDESVPLSSGEPDPLPDVREVDGWVHSSLPLEVRVGEEVVEIARRRQVVSPAGELSESPHSIVLHRLEPDRLAAEAAPSGLRAAGIEPIGQTDDHVGSLVLLLERSDG